MNGQTGMEGLMIKNLNQVCCTKCGVLSPKATIVDSAGDIPFIKARDVHFNVISKSDDKISRQAIKEYVIEIVPKNSVLITIAGPKAGNVALLETDAIVDNNIYYSISNDSKLLPKYLFYYLCFKRNQIIKPTTSKGRVSFGLLNKLGIPIPEIAVQERLVAQLAKQIEVADAVIEGIKKSMDDLIGERNTILQNAFSGLSCNDSAFSSEHVVALKECVIVQAGKTPNSTIKQYFGCEYPLFSSAALYQGMNITTSRVRLSLRGVREARAFEPNSILIGCEGPHFGKAGIARTIGACNSQMIALMPCKTVVPEFLYYQVISPSFQARLKKHSKGQSITKGQFENLLVELPTLETQEKLVNELRIKLSTLDKTHEELKKQLDEAEQMKLTAFSNAFILPQ